MKIPQKIKLTILYNGESIDMDIPTELMIKEVKLKVVHALNQYFKEKSKNEVIPEAVNLYCNEKMLDDEKLLVNYGIWSGSLINMR